MIPLIDLKAQYDSIKDEIDAAMASVISKSQFIGGEERDNFENNFAKYCNKKYCVGTSNGSAALFSALKCLGIKEGDEVIIPVNTFIATAFAVTMCGARPVFVDVNESDFLINVELIEKAITDKTKAIIPVHLYGNICDMDKIIRIGEKHKLQIVEDCAQAHGARHNRKKVPITDIGCFSFFPAKNLGAYGDSGAIITSRKDLAKKCKMFINHGRLNKYFHETEGFNFRMNNLQAAILNVKLKHLDKWLDKKRNLAAIYSKKLGVLVPRTKEGILHSYYVYVIRSENRDRLQEYLKKQDIGTVIHYPTPLHLQPALSYLGHKEGDFPIAEKLAKEILSIPMYAELHEEKQNKVIQTINSFDN